MVIKIYIGHSAKLKNIFNSNISVLVGENTNKGEEHQQGGNIFNYSISVLVGDNTNKGRNDEVIFKNLKNKS